MSKFLAPLLASTVLIVGTISANAAGCHRSVQASMDDGVVAAAAPVVIEETVEVAVSTYGAGKGHLCERSAGYSEANMSVAVSEISDLESAETTYAEAVSASVGFSVSVIGTE